MSLLPEIKPAPKGTGQELPRVLSISGAQPVSALGHGSGAGLLLPASVTCRQPSKVEQLGSRASSYTTFPASTQSFPPASITTQLHSHQKSFLDIWQDVQEVSSCSFPQSTAPQAAN